MAFSETQVELIKAFVQHYSDLGYRYYAVTQQPTSNNQPYDLSFCFMRSEPVVTSSSSGWSILVPADSCSIAVISGNFSSMNTSDRYVYSEVTEQTQVTIPLYLHVSGNVFNSSREVMQVPDYSGEVIENVQTGGILFVFCIAIFLFAFLRLFRR